MAGMGQGERLSIMGVVFIESAFPEIREEGYKITSQETADYNCFAWVVGDTSQWWSPLENAGYFWPPDTPQTLDVRNFVKLYATHGGYAPCKDSQLENGFEKIAIYANVTGDVTHVARQVASGKWTSKIGDWEDIEHNTLAALEGEFYGKVVQILKRAVT